MASKAKRALYAVILFVGTFVFAMLAAEFGFRLLYPDDGAAAAHLIRMQDFLRHHVPDRPGPIRRASDGREIGRHKGLHLFTIGQRRGIAIPSNTDHRAYVVVGKDLGQNALIVAFEDPAAPGLFQSEARVHGMSWLTAPIENRRRLLGRVRYRDPAVELEYIPEGKEALILFAEPQRALAAGQILAFYEGERLLGGAVFDANNT